MNCEWKSNWDETKQHFLDWWNHDGLVIKLPYVIGETPHIDIDDPGPGDDLGPEHLDPKWITQKQVYRLANKDFLGDTLPMITADSGYMGLSLYLNGASPRVVDGTVWYDPLMTDLDDDTPLIFDPGNAWFQKHATIYETMVAAARNRFFVGTAGLGSNIDILATIRGSEQFMLDLFMRPDWVKQKLEEIKHAYYQAFDRLYQIYKLDDESSCAYYYGYWGPGRVSMIMTEVASMISPAMFTEFVLPTLREQCRWLDHSVYLIDGVEGLRFLDDLLSIDELDAISFDAGLATQQGDDPTWYDLYQRILDAGKSVHIYVSDHTKVVPLLTRLGGAGVMLTVRNIDRSQAEDLLKSVETYR